MRWLPVLMDSTTGYALSVTLGFLMPAEPRAGHLQVHCVYCMGQYRGIVLLGVLAHGYGK